MPVLSKRIVLDCFYLLIFYFEKFSTDVCRLPCAINVNLNLSNVKLPTCNCKLQIKVCDFPRKKSLNEIKIASGH